MAQTDRCYDTVGKAELPILTVLENILIDEAIVRDKERKLRQNVSLEKTDSRCLICGRIWYNKVVEKCLHCGGLCRVCPPDELKLSVRYGEVRNGF